MFPPLHFLLSTNLEKNWIILVHASCMMQSTTQWETLNVILYVNVIINLSFISFLFEQTLSGQRPLLAEIFISLRSHQLYVTPPCCNHSLHVRWYLLMHFSGGGSVVLWCLCLPRGHRRARPQVPSLRPSDPLWPHQQVQGTRGLTLFKSGGGRT